MPCHLDDANAAAAQAAECLAKRRQPSRVNSAANRLGRPNPGIHRVKREARRLTAFCLPVSAADWILIDGHALLRGLWIGNFNLYEAKVTSKRLIYGPACAGLYAALKQFNLLSVQPLLDMFAEDYSDLLASQFGEGITIEMVAAKINDEELLEKQLTTDNAVGVRTINEIRSLRGLPSVQWGEERAIPGGGLLGSVELSEPSIPATASEPVEAEPPQAAAADTEVPLATDGKVVEPYAGVQTELTLNGAQIAATPAVLERVQAGTVAGTAAIIAATEQLPPVLTSTGEPLPNHDAKALALIDGNTNGHMPRLRYP